MYSKTIFNKLYKKGVEVENQLYNAIQNSNNEDIPFLYTLVINSSFKSERTQKIFFERLAAYWKELSVGLMNDHLFNVYVEVEEIMISKKHSNVDFSLHIDEDEETLVLEYCHSKFNSKLLDYFRRLTLCVEDMNDINYEYLKLLSNDSFFNKKKKSRLIGKYNEFYSKYITVLRQIHEMERDLLFNSNAIVDYLNSLDLSFVNKISENHVFTAKRNIHGLFHKEQHSNLEREEMVYYSEGIKLLEESSDNTKKETHGVTYVIQNENNQDSHYYLGRSEIQASHFEVTKLISLLVPYRIETTFENKLIKMIENDNTFGKDMPLLIK